jgi:membrane-bound inhibitor of C-type lysozyme
MRFFSVATILAILAAACTPRKKPDSHAEYICKDGQKIRAFFHVNGKDQVLLKLGDGRSMTLPHAVHSPGVRYATRDEKIILWMQRDALFFEEDGEILFADCIPA